MASSTDSPSTLNTRGVDAYCRTGLSVGTGRSHGSRNCTSTWYRDGRTPLHLSAARPLAVSQDPASDERMEDLTRLSRCARCGATLPIEAGGDLCATCAQTIGAAPTILARAATASDETRIVASPGGAAGSNDMTVLSP